MGLSSQQVLSFIPLGTWTHVFLIPGNKPNNDGIYLVTTNEKYLKRCKDMYEMALHSYMFEKVTSYKLMKLVALEIEGLWYRGRMLSYNEFLPKNTAVELIDSGSIVKKCLCDLYKLPDCFKYDPLCLSIKPVEDISYPKIGKLCVEPLLLESELHKGYVVVNTKTIDTINELPTEMNWGDIDVRGLLSLAINTKNICSIKEYDFCMPGNFNNSIVQKSSKSKNLTTDLEELDLKYFTEFSKEIIVTCNAEKIVQLKNLLDNVNVHELKNIFTELITNMPKCLFLKNNVSLNNHSTVNNVTEYKTNEVNDMVAYTDTSRLPDCPDLCINGLNTNEFHIFKNESSVEFCYGTNIDYVYIRSYEQKRKYLKEMKQFYVYCDEKENLKIKTNVRNGDMVAALMTQYNEIHRAVILYDVFKHRLGHLYLCFFIDIGCKEYVQSNHIYYLPEESQNVPYLAHKVGLKNAPLNNTMQLKYLKSYFDELYLQPLIIEFDESDPEGLNNVVLKNKINNMNINLEAKDFLKKKFTNFQKLDNEEMNSKISNYLSYNDLFRNGTLVLITNFDSVNQIFVRINTSELQEYYSQITKEVHQFYQNNKSVYNRRSPRMNERVAVYSSLKKRFVRASVIKKLDETTYSVYLIDYGGRECINTNNIFVLPYLFRHLPQSVIKIGLNGTLSVSKMEKISDYFNQLIQLSVPLIATFDEEDPLGFQNVCLKMVSNGINIVEEICKLPEL